MSEKVLNSRLRIVTEMVSNYTGNEPLSAFLKKQFQKNKKYGSKDRTAISDLMYNFYRMAKFGINLPIDVRLTLGMYLFQNDQIQWNEVIYEKTGINNFSQNFSDRLSAVEEKFNLNKDDLFPFLTFFSGNIDKSKFFANLDKKPHVWIRLRKNLLQIQSSLENEGFILNQFQGLPNAYYVKNPKGLEKTNMYLKGQFEIQDLASQMCSEQIEINPAATIWDACAGSGGKSLYLLDRDPELRVTCTDIRSSIIQNLETRMARSGYHDIYTKVLDLTGTEAQNLWPVKWRYILADVPCSGSGTWSRTPEQMYYFKPEQLNDFKKLQQEILKNLTLQLEKNGSIFYLTCSMFKTENEEVTDWAVKELGFSKKREMLFEGYNFGSDTMYFCHLQKS